MSDMHSYSQRSEGPTVDALALKMTGDMAMETDLRRTQEVEVTVRGIVVGHVFEDKRDKNGDITQTIKAAKVRVDELVDIVVLTVPRRMRGQTAMPLDDEGQFGTDVAIISGEAVVLDDEPADAIVIAGELAAGIPPHGVGQNGQVYTEVSEQDATSDGLPEEAEYRSEGGATFAYHHATCVFWRVGESPFGDHFELDPVKGEIVTPPDDESDTLIDRHAQIPEDAWNMLNREQKLDVAKRMDRITAQQATIVENRNATDVAAATKHLETALGLLRDDYGIELLPAEDIANADAALEGPPPPPITPGSPPVAFATLQARRRYLLAKMGLPAEMEEARREELAEIDERLRLQAVSST